MQLSTAPETRSDLHHARPALVVHTALRRELLLAGPLVRRVADGDTDRAVAVARHIDLVLRMLRHHHETEDEGVFPPLRERGGVELVPLLDDMDRQHATIEALTHECEDRLAAWERDPDPTAGEQLAAVLDELRAALADHLEIEERELFGVAEQHVTAEEWQAIGAQAEAAFTGKERTLVFGILQHGADPAVIAQMLETAPAPVRFLVPHLARRAYRRRAVEIHGTATP